MDDEEARRRTGPTSGWMEGLSLITPGAHVTLEGTYPARALSSQMCTSCRRPFVVVIGNAQQKGRADDKDDQTMFGSLSSFLHPTDETPNIIGSCADLPTPKSENIENQCRYGHGSEHPVGWPFLLDAAPDR